jgi:hypothetical protein
MPAEAGATLDAEAAFDRAEKSPFIACLDVLYNLQSV